MSLPQAVTNLAGSSNNVAAGIGECLQTLVTSMNAANGPIIIEFGERQIAFGRKRIGSMSGLVCSMEGDMPS